MKSIEKSTYDIELQTLAKDAKRISKKTKSESTKRSYKSDLKLFDAWCKEHSLVSRPASSETVGLYIVYLDKIGRKPSTISRTMTSINQAHVLVGHREPVDERVLELKKGINRERGTARKKKVALTLERLRRVIICTDNDYIGIRDKAILLVGWASALRRSELAGIQHNDLEELPEGLAVTIRRSKSDQEGAGRKIGIPFIDGEQSMCPVRAFKRWVALSQTKEGKQITTGPVFRIIGKGGRNKLHYFCRDRGLSDKRISIIVKLAVERAGYDPKEYSGHSLRSGLATTLAHAGISESGIMGITGHKSVATLREYIREGRLFVNHPLISLFSDA
jgi:site-specific recombinase XerD